MHRTARVRARVGWNLDRPFAPVLSRSHRRPLHHCPVCLRKLHWSVGFDPLERYGTLERVNRALGFAEEAEWLNRRMQAFRAA